MCVIIMICYTIVYTAVAKINNILELHKERINIAQYYGGVNTAIKHIIYSKI